MERGSIVERQWDALDPEEHEDFSTDPQQELPKKKPSQQTPKQTTVYRQKPVEQSPFLSQFSPKKSRGKKTKYDFEKQPVIWAVGGGKGGVGKSLIAANFSLTLVQKGYRVLAIDLDLGGSNLHTCLGMSPPKQGLGDWAVGVLENIEDAAVDTTYPNFKIISGSYDAARINYLVHERKDELIEDLRSLDFDHVVMDLGAGTVDTTTDMFAEADYGIVAILPEPTSVENAYRFMRNVLYKKLQQADVTAGVAEVIEVAMDQKNALGVKTPMDLVGVVQRIDPVAAKTLKNIILSFAPNIVMNQVRSQTDIDIGNAIKSVCKRFFNIQPHYAGYIDYDNSVWRAVRMKKAVLTQYPRSVLANRIRRLTESLLEKAIEDESKE